ncbi:MAG: serine/threonine-protein kinase [Myxococcota bacterium]
MADDFPCPSCGDQTAAGPTCSRCGRPLVVLGQRLTRLVGRGSRSSVYEAWSANGERRAVKILPLKDADSWREAELFERGTRILSKLAHPAVAKVVDFEASDTGELRLVTEFFAGGSLAERAANGWHARPQEIRALTVHLLELLVYLHEAQPPILHRDIKPENLLFRSSNDAMPVLTDFDVVAQPAEQRTGLTIVGTPGYAAPEQFAGEATERSDLYGVGATVIFAATHVSPDRIPRREGRLDLGERLDALDANLRRVLLSLVEPRAEDRPASARAALAALTGSVPAPPPRAAGSRQLVVVLALFAFALLGLGVAMTVFVTGSGGTAVEGSTPAERAPAEPAPRAPDPPAPPAAVAPPAPEAPAAPAPAAAAPSADTITFESVPTGASVWLADRLLGTTPLTVDRPEAGRIFITLPGHATTKIDLRRVPEGSFSSKTELAPYDLEGAAPNNDAVQATLALAEPQLAGCGRHFGDAHPGSLRLKTRFQIRRDGAVRAARVLSPPEGTEETARCVEAVLSALEFPPGHATTVNLPVWLEPLQKRSAPTAEADSGAEPAPKPEPAPEPAPKPATKRRPSMVY